MAATKYLTSLCFLTILWSCSGEDDAYLRRRRNQLISPSPAPTSCIFTPSEFETEVLLTIIGDPDLVSQDDVKKVQETFVEEYNRLAEGLCDEQFRIVEEVRQEGSGLIFAAEDEGNRRRMQDKRKFSFRFFVLGVCRGCPKKSRIFNDGYRRALFQDEQEDVSVDFTGERALQSNGLFASLQSFMSSSRPRDIPNIFLPALAEKQPNLQSTSSAAAVAATGSTTSSEVAATGGAFAASTGPEAQSRFNCDCLTDPEAVKRAVGLNEFQKLFNTTITSLGDSGEIGNGIGEVVGIEEVDNVECNREALSDFASEVLLGVTGDPENFSDEELLLLGDLFLEVYSVTNEQFCDPLFRDAIAADVEVFDPKTGTTRRLISPRTHTSRRLFGALSRNFFTNLETSAPEPKPTSSPTSSPVQSPTKSPVEQNERFKPFQFRLLVRGTCRGCPTQSRIFDDGFRRLQEAFEAVMHNRDLIQQYVADEKNLCICPLGSEERAPDEALFAEAFRAAIEEYKAQGAFPNLGTITDAIQVDETEPSVSPSTTPTTSSPTEQPSLKPTSAPPTENPSSSPTRPTIPTESPVPSPSPSTAPSIPV